MRTFLSYFIRSALLLFLLQSAFGAEPAPGQPAGAALNQRDIHSAYNEGDFEKVTNLIESFTAAHKTYSRNDSVFIAKHLAVVYSANPQTREKGRYYMYRLLEMMPTAELVDMFVSDEIDRIFEKVRKEFIARQKSFGVDSSQISMPDRPTGDSASAQASAPKPASSGPSADYAAAQPAGGTFWKRNGMLVAGGLGLAVAGAVAFYIFATDDEPTPRVITIPNETQAKN